MNIWLFSRACRWLIADFGVYVGVAILASCGWATARAAPPPVTPHPGANAALYYYRAFALLPKIPVRTINGAIPRISDYPLDKTTLRQLHAAKWSLRLLCLGCRMPVCNWGDKSIYGQFTFVPPVWVLGQARVLGEIAMLQARLDWGKKRWKRSNRLVAASFILAHHVGQGHMVLGIFTQGVMNDIYLSTLAKHIAVLPKKELRALQRLLANLPPLTPLATALQPGAPDPLRVIMRQLLKRHIEASIWQWVVTLQQAQKYAPGQRPPEPIPPVPAHIAKEVRAAISAMQRHDKELVAALTTPYPQSIRSVDKVYRHIKIQDIASGNRVLRVLGRPWWVKPYYAAQCGTQARRMELRAAIAYLLGGRAAFNKIRDPFGPGPLILEKHANQLVIRSHLNVTPLVAPATAKWETTLTVPLH